jgi:thiol-disulfide isomerase/thioredoxin
MSQKHSLFILLFFLSFGSFCLPAQTLTGIFRQLPHQPIQLEAFNGLKTYVVDSDTTDASGSFSFHYSSTDKGVGFIQSVDKKPVFVLLTGEDIELQGATPSQIETVHMLKGEENQWFEQYAAEQPRREQALSAWSFLETSYKTDPLFSNQKKPNQAIQEEKNRLHLEDSLFVAGLPDKSYVKWYLPTRKLVSSVSNIARYRTDEIPATLAAFRNLNYADARLYRSGLFREAMDNHFWLIENSGKSLDSVFVEMKISIDAMLPRLSADEKKYNEVCDYLFDVLERRSLFQASEYLALKVLNESACTVDGNLARQMEIYRAMKKGNVAPDFEFKGDILNRTSESTKKLSDITTPYRLVVFGAGWCPKCREELNELAKVYDKFRSNGMEVVFVSLDEDAQIFRDFAEKFPFISMCDYKKWENEIAQAYYVFGTPTLFLLDQERKIVLRPVSVKQVDAWVDWFLGGGNR